jgi:hypothetical protein
MQLIAGVRSEIRLSERSAAGVARLLDAAHGVGIQEFPCFVGFVHASKSEHWRTK